MSWRKKKLDWNRKKPHQKKTVFDMSVFIFQWRILQCQCFFFKAKFYFDAKTVWLKLSKAVWVKLYCWLRKRIIYTTTVSQQTSHTDYCCLWVNLQTDRWSLNPGFNPALALDEFRSHWFHCVDTQRYLNCQHTRGVTALIPRSKSQHKCTWSPCRHTFLPVNLSFI